MPSKLRKALGAVKDQTSISLAKVTNNNASNLEVIILKATTHDKIPIDDRYVSEILQLVSSNKAYAASCAQAIAKRIGKTRNWIVALKSLMLVLRIFQDGDPYFPREVLHLMKSGAKILNLSSFRDDSNSSPWDYTAFVRTFALYLDERLDCFLTGKLQRRFTNRDRESKDKRNPRAYEPVRDMKPQMLLDRISCWQKLLDRAIATRPTGAAKPNRLVQISLYAVVQESFDLYKDISDALTLLLDSFFHLQYPSCVNAFQKCIKASKQFEDLCAFYDLCKSIGVGRTSEYPSVQKISDELIETLQEFLKDQASFPSTRSSVLMLPAPPVTAPIRYEGSEHYSSEPTDRFSERGSEYSSQCTSLEDLMSVTEFGTSPSFSFEPYAADQFEKRSQAEDGNSATDSGSNYSLPIDQGSNLNLAVSFDEWPEEDQQQEHEQKHDVNNPGLDSETGTRDHWELVLSESTTQPVENSSILAAENGFEPSIENNFFEQSYMPKHQYNPFLESDTNDMSATANVVNDQTGFDDMFCVAPTFQAAAPTFSSENSDKTTAFTMGFEDENDPFTSCPNMMASESVPNGSLDQQTLMHEQQLWLQNQNKIIAKHMS